MSRANRRLKLCLVVLLLFSAGSALAWDRVYRGSARPVGNTTASARLVTFENGGVVPPPPRPRVLRHVPQERVVTRRPKPVVQRPAPPPPEPRTWKVKRGESLSGIAREVYGDPNRWPDILKANDLDDPDLIREGQVLQIP